MTSAPPQQRFVQFGGEGHRSAQSPEDIQHIITEIERQARTKVDVIVAADKLQPFTHGEADAEGNITYRMRMSVPIPGEWLGAYAMDLNPFAADQLAQRLGIGKHYYDKLSQSDDAETVNLLVQNVAHWLERHGKRFMVRTLDNHIRAFMSDSYKPRDNFDLLNSILQPLSEAGARITRIDLTDTRFYIRALHPEWRERVERQNIDVQTRGQVYQSWMADLQANAEGEIPYFSRLAPPSALSPARSPWDPEPEDGGFGLTSRWDNDWVIPGLVLQNSEIGQGATTISPFALRQICMNGTVMDAAIAVRHVGSKANVLDGFLSAETIAQENALVYSQVRDLAKATFDPEMFRKMVEAMNRAANEIIEKPVEAVDRAIGKFNIDPAHRASLLTQLVIGGDPTVWGLVNAVTAHAQTLEDFDDRMALERVGGEMVARERELVRVR